MCTNVRRNTDDGDDETNKIHEIGTHKILQKPCSAM